MKFFNRDIDPKSEAYAYLIFAAVIALYALVSIDSSEVEIPQAVRRRSMSRDPIIISGEGIKWIIPAFTLIAGGLVIRVLAFTQKKGKLKLRIISWVFLSFAILFFIIAIDQSGK